MTKRNVADHSEYTLQWNDRSSFAAVPISPDLSFTVERFSKTVKGGPKECVVTAFGGVNELWDLANRLRQFVIIKNEHGKAVWWGYLHDLTIRVGKVRVGLSIDNMYNKVKIAYTSFSTRYTTEFAQDDDSVDEYGIKELLRAVADATEGQAENMRSTILEQQKFPHAKFEVAAQSEGSYSARLTFRGLFETIGWRYYAQDKGLIEHSLSGTGIQKVGVNVAKSTISFVAPNLIRDSGSALNGFEKNDIISVCGTSNNNGRFTVNQGTSTGFEIEVEQDITTEGAGGLVTIESNAAVKEDFIQTTGSAWDGSSVQVRAQVVGSPIDDLQVRIWQTNGGSPSNHVATGTLAASDMDTTMLWREIPLGACATLNNSCPYSLVVDRTDRTTSSGSAWYRVDVDEDLGYTSGSLDVYSGSVWHNRVIDADLMFRIVGTQEVTTQIDEMVTAMGQFIADVDVIDQSGIETPQYRDGESTALDELIPLLETGTSSSRLLMATVNENRELLIEEEPAYSVLTKYSFNSDGELFDNNDNSVLLEDCIVGIWATMVDVVPNVVNKALIANPEVMFIEEAEYFVQGKRYIPRARSTDSPWDIGGISEG